MTERQVHLIGDPVAHPLALQGVVATRLFQAVQIHLVGSQKEIVFRENNDHRRRLAGGRIVVPRPNERTAAKSSAGVIHRAEVAIHKRRID